MNEKDYLEKKEQNKISTIRTMISLGIVYPLVHYTMKTVDASLVLPVIGVFIFPILFFGGLFIFQKVKAVHRHIEEIKIALFFIQLFYFVYLLYINDYSRSITFSYWIYILMTASVINGRKRLIGYLMINLIVVVVPLFFSDVTEIPYYLWGGWHGAMFFFLYLIIDSKNRQQFKLIKIKNQLAAYQSENESLIDSLSAMIYYKDTNNKIIRVNQAMANFYGKDPAFFANMSLYDLVPKGRAHVYHEEDLKIIRTGEPMNDVVEEIITPLGERRWLRSDKKPYRDKNGVVKGIVIFSIDITEEREMERQLRQREELFRSVFNQAPYGVLILDLDNKILEANKILCELLGFSNAEITLLTLNEIVHTNDIESISNLYRQITPEQEYASNEVRIKKRGGGHISGNLVATQIRDERGVPLFSLGMLENITEKREAEAQLEVYSRSLEESNKDLEQFAYIISHDMKEPLRMITSYTQLLKRRYSENFDETAHEFMAYVVGGAKRMNDLIDDLLSYSRVGRSTETKELLELEETMIIVLNNLRMQIQDAKAEIIFDDLLPVIYGNRGQMIALFQNLISNAIKYRREGVAPFIELKVEKGEKEWTFSLKDNGIGMNENNLETIFLIFQRLHSHASYSGTGIGLAIAKRIVQSHNGKIWATAKENEGSTFYFTLPILSDKDIIALSE